MSELERDAFYDYNSDDEPSTSKQEDNKNITGDSLNLWSPPFEVEKGESKDDKDGSAAVEHVEEVSTSPLDIGGAGVISCMSTIEEESKTYESSTAPSLSLSHSRVAQEQEQDVLASSNEVKDNFKSSGRNIDEELEELRRFVDRTESESHQSTTSQSQEVPQQSNDPLPTTASKTTQEIVDVSNVSDHDVDALLQKLAKLESTQDILEQILNTGVPEHLDVNTILSQIPLDEPIQITSRGVGDGEDPSERSVSSEIASIQKLIDGVDLTASYSSEVARGNNLFLSQSEIPVNEKAQTISKKERLERDVDDVLKEYEEFERSLSQASGIDDSFRSDIASLHSLSTHSNKASAPVPVPTNPVTVPVIKPPVLKTVVPPPQPPPITTNKISPNTVPVTSTTTIGQVVSQPQLPPSQNLEMFAPPSSSYQSPGKSPSHHGSARTRPVGNAGPKKLGDSGRSYPPQPTKSSRIETSQSAHGIKPQSASHSARPATSSTTTPGREMNQDAFKPRNRRMMSPRTAARQNQPQSINHRIPQSFSTADMPKNSSIGGAGEGYHIGQQHPHQAAEDKTNNLIASEALKTIEKLNTMVARQETLLEAYSKDNDRLWAQLREAKTISNEKEAELQDVINSLKTEMSALKLNRLMLSPRQRPSIVNKEELQRLREDSELKSQQITDLRRELLLLQSKLAGLNQSPKKQQSVNPSTFVAQEKEKEYQKQITALNKQVRTLQKILYSKEQTAPPSVHPSNSNTSQQRQSHSRSRPPMQRAQSSDGFKTGEGNANTQALVKGARSTGVDGSGLHGKRTFSKSLNMNTGEILQASLNCMEQERDELENVITEKDKMIFEKEKMIINLREQIENLKSQIPEGEMVEPGLIDELRSRIITQNKVIQQLKEHLSSFKRIEAENIVLREERSLLEDQVIELRRKLEFAHNLKKPENEVLFLLSEKVDELNSRYFRRERQLDSLLSRLTLKTTASTGGIGGGVLTSSSTSNSSNSSSGSAGISRPLLLSTSSPRKRIGAMDQLNNNNGSLGKTRCATIIPSDILHMADFSPSATFQLDLPEM